MTDPRRVRLSERRDQALDDLIDLERQVAEGEIDETTAQTLRSRYEATAAASMAAIDQLGAPAESSGRSRQRMLAGIGIFTLAATLAVVALVNAVEPRPEGGFVTGGVATGAVADGGGVDLSTISDQEMEEVVSQNPDIFPMRLALARRYVEGGDFSAALAHYLYILEREDNGEALMYVGWMTHASGDSATGASLLERSLEVAPGDPLAMWFLANVRMFGLDDAEGAIPMLEAVIASGLAPTEVVEAAESMLEEARS